jgi:archaellum biogenesis ATPase FlaH
MNKKLALNLLFTFIISCSIAFFGIKIYTINEQSSLEGNQADFIMLLANIFLSLVLIIASLTVFLNNYPKVRERNLYSFLSFFLSLLIATCIFITTLSSNDVWGMLLISSLAFFIPHTFFYIKFAKRVQ